MFAVAVFLIYSQSIKMLQVQRKKFAYLTLLLSVVVVQVLSKQLSVQSWRVSQQ
jgi:hypothetical protein